jgi:diaminopimelate epimerase
MACSLTFVKMEASANDFVVIDNRRHAVRDPKKLARAICERHTGVGGDGLLLLEPSKKARFRMRILNADGSEAEMCGNGSRCMALFAQKLLRLPAEFRFETLAGVIGARVKGDTVRVRLGNPEGFRGAGNLEVDGRPFSYYFLNTGVPHTVLFVDDLDHIPVDMLGRKIRYHERFKPQGTNVDFVQVTGRQAITVRTYERGVGETQACGTGVTASAIVSVLAAKCSAPVKVTTRGGVLTVSFDRAGGKVANVHLEGKARFVFRGEYTIK